MATANNLISFYNCTYNTFMESKIQTSDLTRYVTGEVIIQGLLATGGDYKEDITSSDNVIPYNALIFITDKQKICFQNLIYNCSYDDIPVILYTINISIQEGTPVLTGYEMNSTISAEQEAQYKNIFCLIYIKDYDVVPDEILGHVHSKLVAYKRIEDSYYINRFVQETEHFNLCNSTYYIDLPRIYNQYKMSLIEDIPALKRTVIHDIPRNDIPYRSRIVGSDLIFWMLPYTISSNVDPCTGQGSTILPTYNPGYIRAELSLVPLNQKGLGHCTVEIYMDNTDILGYKWIISGTAGANYSPITGLNYYTNLSGRIVALGFDLLYSGAGTQTCTVGMEYFYGQNAIDDITYSNILSATYNSTINKTLICKDNNDGALISLYERLSQ